MEVCDAARGREAVLARGTGGQMPRAACRARRRALAVQRWVSNSAPRSLGVCIWRARCLGVGARRALARASVGGHARSQGGAGGPRWRRGGAASHDAERRMRCRATDTNKFLVLVLSRNSCERLRIGGGICRARLSRRAPAPPDGARRRAGPCAAAGAGRARAASAARRCTVPPETRQCGYRATPRYHAKTSNHPSPPHRRAACRRRCRRAGALMQR